MTYQGSRKADNAARAVLAERLERQERYDEAVQMRTVEYFVMPPVRWFGGLLPLRAHLLRTASTRPYVATHAFVNT